MYKFFRRFKINKIEKNFVLSIVLQKSPAKLSHWSYNDTVLNVSTKNEI